jgi:hypothetical protein
MTEKVIAEVKTGKSKEEVAFDLFAYASRSTITNFNTLDEMLALYKKCLVAVLLPQS